MKRYIYFVLALVVFVAAIGVACDGTELSEPGATATPTTAAETPVATATATVAPAPTATETPVATPTATAEAMSATAETPAATATATAAPAPTAAATPAAAPMATAAPTSTAAYTPSDDPHAAAYEALLATIPDTPETRNDVYIGNYALARQVFDAATFPLPGPGDDEDAVAAFTSLEWVTMGPGMLNVDYPSALGTSGFLDQIIYGNYTELMAENLQHLAFDVRNIDQSILAGGPNQYQALRGRFDPQATDAALSACSECPAPSIEEHMGIPYYSWGEDYGVDINTKFAPPVFDNLGRGGRIAVLDEHLFRTLGTPEMKEVIGAHLKEVPSLVDVEEFRLLAGGMSRLRAYTMLLSDNVEAWDINVLSKFIMGEDAPQGDIDRMKQQLAESGPQLRPYNAYATGAGKDEEGSYMALVLVHADDASAEENVGLLRKRIEEGSSTSYGNPWSDSIDVDSLEINAEGRLLLAKARGRIAASGGWLQWVFLRDALILYE